MAGDLDFSVQLRVLNEQFNNGINQARDRFTQYAQSVQRNVQQMNTDTERASTMLAGLNNVSSDRLTAEIRATADQLRQMGAGANLSGEQVEAAMQASALQVTRLGRQLEVARSEALRLSQTNASPTDIEAAAANVDRLEQELNQARSASVSLANELSGAMNRASNTADGARNSIYRMANVRVPETIRGEINQLNRALTDFTNNSGRPAAEIERVTRATQEQIRRLEAELNGLDDTQNRVSQGSQRFTGGINGVRNAMGSLQGMLAAAGLGIGIAEIIEVSDAFKTLEARIKLATGEGAAFTTGFEGVKQIANETFSSVENTGELFARITQSAESLGLAQSEVLSVTKTINEAIKLSGGSADAADAAITQLIQGLQSGVVRGEEFNSIMEQAPRLAQAMADGLGVTRGELRELAGEGKLTSEVVINAIQSQGEAIGKEFSTLPNTVGNALQEAKNKIFLFVGEMDKSVNQSSKLAEAINLIGDSLENLDPATVDAVNQVFNQLMTTLGIIWERIVNTYTGINDWIGVLTNTTGAATEQVGIITRTLQGVSIVLGAINDGFKTIAIAGDLVQSVTATWLAMMMRGLSKLTFGELAQSLTDFADRLDNQATKAFDNATNAAMSFESSAKAALDDAAMTAQDRLGAAAKAATDAYDSMKNDANASAEAQEGAFAEMATAQIAAYGESALAALQVEAAERGLKVAIDETGKAIIEKMSSEEQASTAAEQNAKALDKTYRELADTLGVGITQGYADAKASVLELSDSFDVLTDSGYQTGDVLKAALTKMTEQAKNTTELQDIIIMWEDLGEQGQLTGEDLAAGLDLANERLDALTDGVNSVNEAYKVLGLTTRAEAAKQAEAYTQAYGIIVKDGEATAGQLIDGFKKYAKAAVAANGDVVTAQLKTEAAQRGLTIAVDETGRVTFEKMGQAKEANDRVTRSVGNIRTAYDGISSSAGSAGNSMVRAANEASSAYDRLQKKIKAVKEAQAVENADETLKNLRIYGKEEAPVEGNQFGTRLAVENFLKSQGLSEAAAIEEARKLYAKQGTSGGALNFGKLQGFDDGQMMTPADLNRFKSASVYLAEIAEKARQNERQSKKSSRNSVSYDDSKNLSSQSAEEWRAYEKRVAEMRYKYQQSELERARTNGLSGQDLRNQELVAKSTAKIYRELGGSVPQPQPSASKTIDVNLRLGGTSVPVQVAENQEASLMALLQQLQDSKAIAGY